MPDTHDKFYLGRTVDPATAESTGEPLLYDPPDLTTHAVVVGMTGSGKTGLCIDLLEEAALQDVPALMVDPKGDITNALLHFPDLLPDDFAPWINADAARREGKSVDEMASDTADLWRSGLAQWDITPERIQALKDSVQFAIYTPGSDAGLPVSILSSFEAPEVEWESNKETLREQISGTVTALLGLIGLRDIDPVRSREHILLSNIFENAWSQGQDLDIGALIMQTQSPPFDKLGFFDINTFFPEKDRFELAMLLNNMVAAPAFQAWIAGEALDIERLLYQPDGRPRHTIFYIAHLSEAERMFFVTLLYSAVETWVRAQSGTTSLRALVYFDEIFGYMPPVGNPPSKEPMLRLLKQARAFGVGMVLATQNPVDVDYKALSNAGTWFIGKLGTDQDKQRLLDGLSSAVGGGLDRRAYDDLISALGKRMFVVRNVHEKQPAVFQTRWAMNYLAGPMTRMQIPALNVLAGVGESAETAVTPSAAAATTAAPAEQGPELPGSETRTAVPSHIDEYVLPNNLTLSEAAGLALAELPQGAQSLGLLYRPVLLAQASVRFYKTRYDLSTEQRQTCLVPEVDPRGVVHWDDFATSPIDVRSLRREPAAAARFTLLEAPFSDNKAVRALQSDFTDWIYRNMTVTVRANETLGIYAGPDVDEEAFRMQCLEAAEDAQESEVEKLEKSYEKKLDSLRRKLEREERELREDEAELARRKQEEVTTYADTFFSLFSKRKRSISSAMTKRRMSARAEEDVEESKQEIEMLQADIAQMQADLERELDEIEARWLGVVDEITEIPITPYKKDIDITLFGLAWLPYHLVQEGERIVELPGFAVSG